MELYPNIVECFKIVTNIIIYNKLAFFIENEKLGINPMKLFKPNINDDIYLIQEYFNESVEMLSRESIYPLIIKEGFFLEYYKCFEKESEDFNKNLIIIDMLKLFNSKIHKKINTTKILKMHYDKGILLLKNNKLKNENFIKFIQSFKELQNKEELIEYFPNGIEFNENNNIFINNILNEDIYDLKEFLGDKYDKVFKKIFEKFILPKDLTALRFWILGDQTPISIISILMTTIKRVWLNNPENNMYGMDKLFSMVFSRASLSTNNYLDIILELEKKISPVKLMIIFSNILIKNYKIKLPFKEHMKSFIKSNKNTSPLYLWFLLSTYNDKMNRNQLLQNSLTNKLAVEYSDFIDYPKKLNERIALFTNLRNNNFIPGNFKDSDYYKDSMASKNYLEKNIFKNAIIINNNLDKIYKLLNNFFTENEEDILQIEISITIFRDKVEIANKYSDSLKTIQKFWNTFFQQVYKDKLKKLQERIDKFDNTILEDTVKEKDLNKDILNKAEEGKEFIDSIFFMEIYNRLKKNFNDEEELYKRSVEKFMEIKIIGENNDLNLLDDDLKNDIINASDKNEKLLLHELEFIKKYFKFGENNKYNNYNITNIYNNIQNLVKIKEKGGMPAIDVGPTLYYGENFKSSFHKILYNASIFQNTKERNYEPKFYKTFLEFYPKMLDIDKNLVQMPIKDKCIDIIYVAKKLFYLLKNLGIIDDNKSGYKDDILFLQELSFKNV